VSKAIQNYNTKLVNFEILQLCSCFRDLRRDATVLLLHRFSIASSLFLLELALPLLIEECDGTNTFNMCESFKSRQKRCKFAMIRENIGMY
jgi:hypothetical protein